MVENLVFNGTFIALREPDDLTYNPIREWKNVIPEIIKTHGEIEIATLTLPTHEEHCITVQSSEVYEMQRRLHHATKDRHAELLSQFVFAGTRHYEEFSRGAYNPLVWLQGDACTDGALYSTQAFALSGLNPQLVSLNGRDMGFTYEDESARYCRLCGVIPQDVSASRKVQTRSAFEVIDAVLKQNDFQLIDIVRTWIYLDQILEWYGDFNEIRTQYFHETGIFDHRVPASTGIGAGNPSGSAIMMDVLAVQPKAGRLQIQEVISPLQNPALDYKSSFSRAVEMAYSTHKSLMISGTASIDAKGSSVHLDDPEKQIRHTLDVIKAILDSRGMDWGDLFRGIAYFKDMAYLPIYQQIAAELGITRFPLAISHADICRHNLLFEIEVDAVKLV